MLANWPLSAGPEIAAAHANFWASLLQPGTFLTPAERVQVVRVCRAARGCSVSKALAVGPFDPEVANARLATFPGCTLPRAAIDVIHRCVNDSGRAADGHTWYTNATAKIGAGAYVELVALAASLTQVDTFMYALGLPLDPIPALTTAAAAAPPPPRVLALGQATHVDVDAQVPTVPYFDATDPITKMLYYGTPAGYVRWRGHCGCSSVCACVSPRPCSDTCGGLGLRGASDRGISIPSHDPAGASPSPQKRHFATRG